MADPTARSNTGTTRAEGVTFTFDNADVTALMAEVIMGGIAQSLVLEGVTALTSLSGLVLMECRLLGMGLRKAADGQRSNSTEMMPIIIFERERGPGLNKVCYERAV